MLTQAVRIHRHGGPDVLVMEDVELAPPGEGELQLRQTAIGLNFAEIYQRAGDAGPHSETKFPAILGSQGAGVIEALGPGVDGFEVGETVAYMSPGAYAVRRNIPAARTVRLPAGITAELAAATLLRGMTAEYLLHRLYKLQAGETVLVHAAAGGMGEILVQWAKGLGATVIGTVGSAAKAELAKAHGCDAVINYSTEDFVARVTEITGGAGVHVAYDSVGKDAFVKTLDCMRPKGWVISYGAASGPVGQFDLQLLHHKSLIVTRPTLRSYTATMDDLRTSAATFFAAVERGAVKLDISQRYALKDVQQAHADLEGRRTTGASILIP